MVVMCPSTSHTTFKEVEKLILQFIDGTQIVNPRFFYKIYQGYGFAVSRRFEGVAADASVDVYFENPAGSGRQVFIVVVDVVGLAQLYTDLYRANTVTAHGTSITPVNLNFEKTIASVVNVEYNGTYTTGPLVESTVVPGGTKIRAVGGAVEVGQTVVIPENFNFLIRVTNKSANPTDLSIRIIWWEETL